MKQPLLPKHAKQSGLATPVIIVLVLVGLLLFGGLSVSGMYNGLVQKDTLVEQKASDLDSQMKRRADLIPNLVATVKGYASHEKEVFTNIANARSRLLNTNVASNPEQAAQANQSFNSALGRLLALAETYPQLKADQNFIRLQDELTGTENRINYARVEFNDAIKNYNLTVRGFPTNLAAGLFGFERKAPFEALAQEKAVPKVAF